MDDVRFRSGVILNIDEVLLASEVCMDIVSCLDCSVMIVMIILE